ncbi:MAG: hypothetical protein IKY83_12715 [Proteobacteria bacterium]|nr:hypothetical protein [Pseudomonadota bacterium]
MSENKKQINPLMIQSYFDGELKSDELEAISHDALVHSQEYEAMDELRRVVRTESRLALEDIDGCALLDAINSRIDADCGRKVVAPDPLSLPKRRTSAQFFRRWAPALIGAALFLLSVPGLAHWIVVGVSGNSGDAPQVPAVVVIDSNAAHSQEMVSYKKADAPGCMNGVYPQQNVDAVVNPASRGEQLTVDEMDVALRHLIQRIETLEEVNRNSVETGKRAVFPSAGDSDNTL